MNRFAALCVVLSVRPLGATSSVRLAASASGRNGASKEKPAPAGGAAADWPHQRSERRERLMQYLGGAEVRQQRDAERAERRRQPRGGGFLGEPRRAAVRERVLCLGNVTRLGVGRCRLVLEARSGSTEARADGHTAVRGRGRAAPRVVRLVVARAVGRGAAAGRAALHGAHREGRSRHRRDLPSETPPFCAAGQAPPRRSGLADGRQRPGRIRLGAASANGRGGGSAGRDSRTGSRASRCGPVVVVPRDGPRLGDA